MEALRENGKKDDFSAKNQGDLASPSARAAPHPLQDICGTGEDKEPTCLLHPFFKYPRG